MGRAIPIAKASPTRTGSPEMKPRPASSRAVTGLTEATAWIQHDPTTYASAKKAPEFYD